MTLKYETDEKIDDAFDLFKEKGADPLALAKDYYFWSEKIDKVKIELKKSEKKLKELEQNLYEAMMEAGIKMLKMYDKKIEPRFQYWASIPAEKSVEGFPQIRAIGLGDLIENKVNSTTFSAQVRQMIKEGRLIKNSHGDWLIDGEPIKFNLTEKKIVSITKG